MKDHEEYERICSVEEYFEDPYAPEIYEDIKYVLMNKSGDVIGNIFYFLTECRGGPVIYFTNEDGHYRNITSEDIAEEDEEYFGSYIAKRSEEYSKISSVLREFNFNETDMAKEVVKLRNIIKSKDTVVNRQFGNFS